MVKKTRRHADGSAFGEIGVTDPFQLVRLLARSQSDPRKAVSELVQNALDEQATKIHLVRRKFGRELRLSITDNGRGVLPHLGRAEALETIARSIGHSRKRQMSFDERMRAAMLGQYGIGLLGFWSVGHELRMYSRVEGSEVWCLTLIEDSPKFEVSPATEVFEHTDPTWTEVQIVRIHPAAVSSTSGQRLQKYMSAELRGQIIKHGAEISIVDAAIRGATDRVMLVTPAELAGERLQIDEKVKVPGFEYPLELNLFFTGDASTEDDYSLRLAAAGAVVVDDVREHPGFQFAPWFDSRMAGVIDFPHLEIPPGSRRGFVANEAAEAMFQALRDTGPGVAQALREKQEVDASKVSAGVQKQLAKLFARATHLVPHLEWFEIGRRVAEGDGSSGDSLGAESTLAESEDEALPAQAPIFPPGPAVVLRLTPKVIKLQRDETVELRATARDADGRKTEAAVVSFELIDAPVTEVARTPTSIELRSSQELGSGKVRARFESLEADALVMVAEAWPRSTSDSGIPTPEEVNEPQATWRSRWHDGRWRINVGHADYKASASDTKGRVQYLAQLLAKEVVARNFPRPEVAQILEEMVGVLSALERTKPRPKLSSDAEAQ